MAPDSNDILSAYWGLDHATSEAWGLKLIVEIARGALQADESSILVHDRAAGELVLAEAAGAGERLRGQRVAASRGLVGLAMATGEVRVGAPKFLDAAQSQMLEEHGRPAWVLAAPILAGEEPLGVLLALRSDATAEFTARDVALVGQLAHLGGVLLGLSGRMAEMLGARDSALGEHHAQQRRLAAAFAGLMHSCEHRLTELEAVLRAIGQLMDGRV
jgi:hypothetical protein